MQSLLVLCCCSTPHGAKAFHFLQKATAEIQTQLATYPKWLAKLMETQKRKKFLIMIKPETVPLSIPEEMSNAGGCFGKGATAHFVLTLQQYKKKEKLLHGRAAGQPTSARTASSALCVFHKLLQAYVNIICLCKILYLQGHVLPSADSKLQNRKNS